MAGSARAARVRLRVRRGVHGWEGVRVRDIVSGREVGEGEREGAVLDESRIDLGERLRRATRERAGSAGPITSLRTDSWVTSLPTSPSPYSLLGTERPSLSSTSTSAALPPVRPLNSSSPSACTPTTMGLLVVGVTERVAPRGSGQEEEETERLFGGRVGSGPARMGLPREARERECERWREERDEWDLEARG